MPQYNYVTEGGEEFSAFQRMADPPLTRHPETGEACRRTPPRGVNAIDWTDAGAKTVAQQADRNMRRLGASKVAELQERHTPAAKRPSYLPKGEAAPDVAKLKDVNHYIRTGEVK